MPEVVLLIVDGDQVPVIEFVDVVFNEGAAVPVQKGAIVANVVVTFGVTVTEAE